MNRLSAKFAQSIKLLPIFIGLILSVVLFSACQPKRFYLPVVKSQPGNPPTPELAITQTNTLEQVNQAPTQPPTTVATSPNVMLPMVSKPVRRSDLAWQIIPDIIQGNQGSYTLQLVSPKFVGQSEDTLEPINSYLQLLVNRITEQFLDNSEQAPDNNQPGFSATAYQVTSNNYWLPNQPFDPYTQLPPPVAGTMAVYQGKHDILSLLFETDSYFGGAHPNRLHESINYDLTAGKILTFQDIFIPGSNFLDFLSLYSKQELSNRPGLLSEMISAGAAATPENYKNWNITPFGLLITFEEYQVGPYVAGVQQVLIPYRELAVFIDPDGPLGSSQ